MLEFTLLKTTGTLTPRLGRLALPGRRPILTPAFIASTSRGVVPHISQDNFRKCIGLDGVYVAFEDFIEKHPQTTPPLFQVDASDPFRKFTALPDDTLFVLGARRSPPIPSPTANTNTEISVLTSVGYRSINSDYFAAAARKLHPDIVVGLADIPYGQETIGTRRKDKMSDRTEAWTRDMIAKQKTIPDGEPGFNIFAPILPVERDLQSWYLDHLVDDMLDKISGIAIYDAYLLDNLPEELLGFPRLSFHVPAGPQELLRQISLGIDLFTVPFISSATDAGIALNFSFPPPSKAETSPRQSLGIDMWHAEHALSLAPLSEDCSCRACTKHHRAYIQHLLSAKEMLGWVLIQMHNHAILSNFFASVRASIEADTFDADVAAFESFYEPQLPSKTGQGPRVRGYQFKSEEHGKTEKKNPKAFRKFDGDITLKAAHGQQPNKKPAVREVIDDDALVGLVDMEDANGEVRLDTLRLEDDEGGAKS